MMTLIQFQGGRCAYVEVPAEYSVEVDTPFDLAFAEQVAVIILMYLMLKQLYIIRQHVE